MPRRSRLTAMGSGLSVLLSLSACLGNAPAPPSPLPPLVSPSVSVATLPPGPAPTVAPLTSVLPLATLASPPGFPTATGVPPAFTPPATRTTVRLVLPTPRPRTPTRLPVGPTAPPTRPPATPTVAGTGSIRTVFVIVMENHNWADIQGSSSAPYLNGTLLPQSSYATRYYNPPGVHPSEPNYLWLEAGTDFGIANDAAPAVNHQATTQHLVSLLTAHGLRWKAYQEGISGTGCPLTASGLYAPKHNPMVFFDDVTNRNSAGSAMCIAHERSYSELAADLAHNTVADYNFITPNLCDDMHDVAGCASRDSIRNGDTWLAAAVPPILASAAYQTGGVLFITWDEGEGGSDGPIGLLALSPFAKGQGYASTIRYTHSTLLRTIQEIFGVTPLLGAAAQSPDLRDLFQQFP